MEREIDLLQRVANFLIEHGYPEDSIILEWKITERYRVDMAIIDNKSKKPIALFEFKRQKQSQSENMAIEQLKQYAEALGDSTIPLYVVFGSDQPPGFELFFLTEEDGNEILKTIPQFPPFTYFKNSFISKLLSKKEKEKTDTYNWFQIICWILAFLVALLLFFDFMGCLEITTERLGIIAVIIALVVFPFARKLKILGVEFERLQEDKKD